MKLAYDALFVVSFGGPNKGEDVMPFLENVTRGRNIPRERLEHVAVHYHHFGGKSPINEQNLALIAALKEELARRGHELPVYWGNRNWYPLIPETLQQMKDDRVGKAIALFTSAFSSYSGCRQYRENIIAGREVVGEGAPEVDKLRVFYNHPGFLQPMADGIRKATDELQPKSPRILFTAHSIPNTMAEGCRYEIQLREASKLCHEMSGSGAEWELVYQSRSGSPTQPWLEPDVCDRIKELHEQGVEAVVIVPIGFVSDHMEILYDLDTEALELCQELGMAMKRVPTVGTDPRFVSMLVDLIEERSGLRDKVALGEFGPSHDVCPLNCCLPGAPSRPR